MKNSRIIIIFIIALVIILPYALQAQDNIFNGSTDSDWNVATNWSTGAVPTATITGVITIAAICTNANAVNYTFQSGSTLKVNTGVSFTNNGTGTWTMQGTVINEGTYTQAVLTNDGTHIGTGTFTGNLTLNGALEPGYSCGDPLVYGGQSYATVQIGTQCWMAENLNIGTMINGSNNQMDNSTIEKYCYNDNTANCATYGGLYQWNEMMQYVTTESTQGVCPTGWHLPSDTEWTTLTTTLGGTGSNTGSKMADNAALWNSGALESDSEFGNSALAVLPAGHRLTNGSFDYQGYYATLWSSTETGSNAWTRDLYYNNTDVYRNNYNKAFGFSVRCVRD
jgi:uncharacterized protein (TIGR02145 family)